ncbi:MAG TPA: signal peptide peptidase SppA [Polyangiaceae bacterium]|nr:signal peptide peptidase SppA [Polyangiaceae bacterium]
MKLFLKSALTVMGVGLGLAGTAFAQTPVDRPTPIPAFGRSIVSGDDTTALVNNPALLGFLPASEFRWSSVYLDDKALVPWQGHALAFGFPIPFLSLATGLRYEFIDPPSTRAARWGGTGSNYEWLTWGLALRGGDAGSLGFSLQHARSEDERIHGLASWSLGLVSRPVNQFGFALVGHDLNAPVSDGGVRLDRKYDMGVAIRPTGTEALEVGLEASYIDGDSDYWIPRGTLGVALPSLGMLRGEFSMSDPTEQSQERAWLASAQLAFYMNGSRGSMELAAGSVFGTGLGDAAADDAYENIITDVAFRGFREKHGSEARPHALRIRIEDTGGARDHVRLLRKLWSIAEQEPSVAAVVFEVRSAPAESLARVQELRDAIMYLRLMGKKVLCHLEDADGSSLYFCSLANKIYLNPAGGIRFAGLRTRYFYYKGLMDKLGIRADFVRIGAHKSAPEAFTREGSSDVARADKIDLLQQYEKYFTLGVAAGRRIDPLELRKRIATGPFVAKEAKDAGLVDGFAFDDEIEQKTSELVGWDLPLIDDERAPRKTGVFGPTPGIALIYVDGDMVDGRSQAFPIIGMRLAGSYTIADAIKDAREDPRIKAVVLRIETGGGSAMAADVIWRQVQLTTRIKPVIVSMGSAAASGGYYIAAPATKIYANPLSITGSIGIFYGKADVAELLRKIGVSVEVYKTAPRADGESIFRPFSDEERKELEHKVGQFYDMFLDRVATGRKLTKEQVDTVAQGRVWTGEQAKSRRLVDELGGLRQALAEARRLAGLPEYAPIQELPVIESSIVGRLLGFEGVKAGELPPLPGELYEMAKALAPFAVHPSDKPLARMEFVPVAP